MSTAMISLVSDQPMPNVIAALQCEPRPERVEFLVSLSKRPGSDLLVRDERYENIAKTTAGVLREFGIHHFSYHDVKPYDMEDVKTVCQEAAQDCWKADTESEVIFNITEGTKLMAWGAYQAAEEMAEKGRKVRAVYVETGSNQIICLIPAEEPASIRPLALGLNVFHYLRAQGISIQNHMNGERRGQGQHRTEEAKSRLKGGAFRDAVEYLGENVVACYPFLDTIRFALRRAEHIGSKAASGAEDRERIYPLTFTLATSDLEKGGLNLIETILAWDSESSMVKSGSTLELRVTRPMCEFIRGHWLEFYVLHRVMHPKSGLTDPHMGLKVVWVRKGSKPINNELDVIALSGARPVICSCKSGKMTRHDLGGYEVDHNEALYQLGAISQLAGLYCGKVWAVGRGKGSGKAELTENLIERALIMGIAPVYGNDLRHVPEIMSDPEGHIERLKRQK